MCIIMSTNKVEAGFVQAQSDNLPKVDSFMVFDYLDNHSKFTSAKITLEITKVSAVDKEFVVKVGVYRAADWNLQEPQWTGRMRLVAKGEDLTMKLEDKTSGELFAKCPIDKYPGVALESVTDSSRYFVVRIQDDNGRNAYIGLGFGDRSDSFDLNVALQDHFKWLRKEQEEQTPQQQLDLGFKEGETIKINMKITKKDGGEGSKPRRAGTGAVGGLLPPPPGGSRLPPPPSPQHAPSPGAVTPQAPNSDWGDFNSASTAQKPTTPANQQNWVQF